MKLIFFIGFLTLSLFAKDLHWEESLIKGELENGFKYTIKKNEKPADKAELRLLVKAGSLDEDDDQKGIAHLVEHMAFNGTKNFKGNDLIKFLESIGVGFGSHLNASTGIERTIYKLSVPLKKDNLQKSFLVFKDWAGGLEFTQKELDKERGVVLEEARSRDNASFRIYLQNKDLIYEGSKYKDRTPIGDLDIIKNISLDRVKAFYDDWYRPELMHFVAVGDFDVKEVEQFIKESFSNLKNKSQRKHTLREIKKIDKTRVGFAMDKELQSNYVALYFFDDYEKLVSKEQYKQEFIDSIAMGLFNQATSEQLTKKNPIAKRIVGGISGVGHNLVVSSFYSDYQKIKDKEALKELVNTIYSIDKYGFNKNDFKAYKKDMILKNKLSFEKRKDKSSGAYANDLVNLAIDDDIYVDEKFKYEFIKKSLESLTLAEVNKSFSNLIDSKSRLLLFASSHKSKLGENEVKKIINSAKDNLKDKKEEKTLPKKLINKKLEATKIKDEIYNKKYDFREFTLKNGARVIFKKNDYEKDNVRLYSFSKGGFSLVNTKDLTNAKFASKIISSSGLAGFSAKELSQIYSGKSISLKPYISRLSEGFRGSSYNKDFEDLLEILYLYHTEFYVDNTILDNLKNISEYKIKQENKDPKLKFSKELLDFYYKGNKRYTREDIEDIRGLDKEKIEKIFADRFSDAGDFTYVIIGDIDYEKVKTLMSKYVGNLSSIKREESFKDRKISPLKGKNEFIKYYENRDISTVVFSFRFDGEKFSLKRSMELKALEHVLSVKLRELIREEKSGVYGVRVSASMERNLNKSVKISIMFNCEPKRKDELASYVKKVIDEIKTKEVKQEYINSFVKKAIHGFKEYKKTPSFWQGELRNYAFYGDEIRVDEYEKIYKGIDAKIIKVMANRYLDNINVIYSELNPKTLKR